MTVQRAAVLLVVLVVAAGCGGTKKSAPATIAGSQTTANFLSPTFKQSARSAAQQVSVWVTALQKNLAANAQVSGSLLKTNCLGYVNGGLIEKASSAQEKQIATTLAHACHDLASAVSAAKAGKATKAKQLASQALSDAKLAASAAH